MGGQFQPEVSTTPDKEISDHGEKDDHVIETPDIEDVQVDPTKELYDSTGLDPVLAKKMALINDAIDEIGMTPFQWKLFFLNGFGYAVDSVSESP
jgi:hypothetical protein